MNSSPLSRAACAQAINLSQCRFLERRYPQLGKLALTPSAETAAEVFKVYCAHVKQIDPVAGAVDLIAPFEKAIGETRDNTPRDDLQIKLFHTQAARGMVHKVTPFAAGNAAVLKAIGDLQAEHALHYGVNLAHYDMTNIKRGHGLRMYFAAHNDLLRGRRILHFAPEAELRPWMAEQASKLEISYLTADGFAPNVDYYLDLCALALPDESFDFVIMHRVLEHVIDDGAALRELHRVLRPGGVLNISVPESLYLARTADWRVPDPRAHMHFRIYGRDFPAVLMAAGFTVKRCDWLLKQPKDKLRAADAYPMLFYNATKA